MSITVHVYQYGYFYSYGNSLKIENTKVLLSPNCALIPIIGKDHNLRSFSDRDLKILQFVKDYQR